MRDRTTIMTGIGGRGVYDDSAAASVTACGTRAAERRGHLRKKGVDSPSTPALQYFFLNFQKN